MYNFQKLISLTAAIVTILAIAISGIRCSSNVEENYLPVTRIFTKQQFIDFLETSSEDTLASTQTIMLVGNDGKGGWTAFPVLELEGNEEPINLLRIPENIIKLKNLEYLDVSGLAVREIPAEFYALNQLKKLHLNLHTNMDALEEGKRIKQHFKLEELYLVGNVKNKEEYDELESMFSTIKTDFKLCFFDDTDED